MPTWSRFFVRWMPTIVWMSLIFAGSSDASSGQHTSGLLLPLLHWLFGKNLAEEKAQFIHHLFRKAGHVSEYAVLAVLNWRALQHWSPQPKLAGDTRHQPGRYVAWSLGLTAIYAGTDEFHQLFVPTRTASLWDVLIDTMGGGAGLAFYLSTLHLIRRLRGRRPTQIVPLAE